MASSALVARGRGWLEVGNMKPSLADICQVQLSQACWDAKIGPILNNDDAGKKAFNYMGARNGVAWTGNWNNIISGQMSVINICRVRGQTWNVQVGPIWNNDHACQKAQEYLRGHPGHAWTGAWCTTDPGKMSVLRMMKVD